MFKLLLVSPDKTSLSGLASALAEYSNVDLSWTEYGKEALDIASNNTIDLVVTDEWIGDMTGLEFADRLLTVNPRINCASVSQLSHDEFHAASEGLGIMAQLPSQAGREDAERLIQHLKSLKGLIGDTRV